MITRLSSGLRNFKQSRSLRRLMPPGKISSFNAALTWSKKTGDGGDLRPSPDPWGGRASGLLAQDSYDFNFMSSEYYINAVGYVAAQLMPDPFATYFERTASLAQGFEYMLKSNGGKGGRPVVYIPHEVALDKRAKVFVASLRRALLSKVDGDTNPLYNATVAQARNVQFKFHPSCKQLPKSGPASKSKVQF